MIRNTFWTSIGHIEVTLEKLLEPPSLKKYSHLEDGMNTVLGYKKKLKVIEYMIHIDDITIIYYIHTHSSISHNVETIHPKFITYFTVLWINV